MSLGETLFQFKVGGWNDPAQMAYERAQRDYPRIPFPPRQPIVEKAHKEVCGRAAGIRNELKRQITEFQAREEKLKQTAMSVERIVTKWAPSSLVMTAAGSSGGVTLRTDPKEYEINVSDGECSLTIRIPGNSHLVEGAIRAAAAGYLPLGRSACLDLHAPVAISHSTASEYPGGDWVNCTFRDIIRGNAVCAFSPEKVPQRHLREDLHHVAAGNISVMGSMLPERY